MLYSGQMRVALASQAPTGLERRNNQRTGAASKLPLGLADQQPLDVPHIDARDANNYYNGSSHKLYA